MKQQLHIRAKSTKSNRFISGGSANQKGLYSVRNQPFSLWTGLGYILIFNEIEMNAHDFENQQSIIVVGFIDFFEMSTESLCVDKNSRFLSTVLNGG